MPVLSDPPDIIRELITLRKRTSEITSRVRRDLDLLTDAYRDLADLVAGTVAAQPWRPSAAARGAPQISTAVSESHSIDPSTRLIRLGAVCTKVGLSRSTIWRMMKDGKFPPPKRLSTHAVAWLEADVNEWVRARVVIGEPGPSPSRGRQRR